MLALTHIRLLLNDVDASLPFYRDQLGLGEPAVAVPGIYYEFTTGSARLGLYDRASMQTVGGVAQARHQGDQALLTFAVDDVDATYAQLRARGVEFLGPPQDQPAWVLRVVHLRDPEGNLIEINTPLTT